MSQVEQIRDYLETHPEGITPLEALDLFGTFRLGGRIHDIRNGVGCDPMAVETEWETKNGKKYARYKKRMVGETVHYTVLDEVAYFPKKIPKIPQIKGTVTRTETTPKGDTLTIIEPKQEKLL